MDSHMALLGIKLDSRNLLQSDGLQVQLMQMLQLMAEYGIQFKEIDKRLEQNSSQLRELKLVTQKSLADDVVWIFRTPVQ